MYWRDIKLSILTEKIYTGNFKKGQKNVTRIYKFKNT